MKAKQVYELLNDDDRDMIHTAIDKYGKQYVRDKMESPEFLDRLRDYKNTRLLKIMNQMSGTNLTYKNPVDSLWDWTDSVSKNLKKI